MKNSKVINAPNGLTGEELSAWKAAGRPKRWPPEDEVIKNRELILFKGSKEPSEEFPPLPPKEKMLAKIAKPPRKGPTPGKNFLAPRLEKQHPSRFRITPEYSLYFKVYVQIGASIDVIQGQMDSITKQCNIENISVPRHILPQVLLAYYGKNLINIIYESQV